MKKFLTFLLSAILLLAPLSLFGCSDSEKDGNSPKNELKSYTVTFETNGGNAVSKTTTALIEKAPHTSKKNHLLEGWFLDKTLLSPAIFPLTVDKDITLYAKWLKISDYSLYEESHIKDWSGFSPSAKYYITPDGFDLDRLSELNYRMNITVNYEVYYRKDYDALFDIGYAGAPKYEVYVYNSQNLGVAKENLSTTTSTSKRSITYTANMADLKNEHITLKFSTDNIQNIIYFKNISVSYSCVK